MVYEEPKTYEKMSSFEGPSLPHPHCLYLGDFYSIQRHEVKDFLESVYIFIDKSNFSIQNSRLVWGFQSKICQISKDKSKFGAELI